MDTDPLGGRSSGSRRRIATAALLVVLVVSIVGGVVVLVVRTTVLSAATYSSALVEADAYERIYTEVLADPELATLKERLLGDLGLGPTAAVQLRSLTTNVARWTIPPSTLEAEATQLIAGLLAYIRGDDAELDLDVDVGDALARIDGTAVTETLTLLATSARDVAASAESYRAAVTDFARELAAGRVPATVPEAADGSIASPEVVDAILDGLGLEVDDELRLRVTVAVLAGDERDALISAGAALVATHAETVADGLAASTEDGREFDVVAGIAERADRSRAQVVGSLDAARGLAAWFSPVVLVVLGLLAAGSTVAVVWLHRDDGRRAGALLAAAAVAAGLASIGLWRFLSGWIAEPLDRATGAGPGSWGLPAGLRSLLGDVRSEIGGRLEGSVLRWSLPVVAVGLGLAVLVALPVARRWSGGRRVAGGFALAAAVLGLLLLGRSAVELGEEVATCNGHAELCDRRYDDVVYAATHNAMSSPDVVAVWPEHDGDLRAQLDAGVRALLIDTHYWTALESVEQLRALEPLLPADAADEVFRLTAPFRSAREGTFLCHNHCAFGGTPFLDGMVSVREFLADNPTEVVTLIIQDAISPEDTASVMHAAGLDPYLFDHEPDEPWPTLGAMVESGNRLVVFAEVAGPPPPWYGNAFAAMRETPFLFLSPEQFSCRANRGAEDASLFLLNHWVQRIAPDRVDSVRVNTLDALVQRARQCEQERGRIPNYLAVNFYNIGALMEAVDVLNEVGTASVTR